MKRRRDDYDYSSPLVTAVSRGVVSSITCGALRLLFNLLGVNGWRSGLRMGLRSVRGSGEGSEHRTVGICH